MNFSLVPYDKYILSLRAKSYIPTFSLSRFLLSDSTALHNLLVVTERKFCTPQFLRQNLRYSLEAPLGMIFHRCFRETNPSYYRFSTEDPTVISWTQNPNFLGDIKVHHSLRQLTSKQHTVCSGKPSSTLLVTILSEITEKKGRKILMQDILFKRLCHEAKIWTFSMACSVSAFTGLCC